MNCYQENHCPSLAAIKEAFEQVRGTKLEVRSAFNLIFPTGLKLVARLKIFEMQVDQDL
jgi:hypothetical protein